MLRVSVNEIGRENVQQIDQAHGWGNGGLS